jgi:hypothetical protein
MLPINHPLRTGEGLLPINHPLHLARGPCTCRSGSCGRSSRRPFRPSCPSSAHKRTIIRSPGVSGG